MVGPEPASCNPSMHVLAAPAPSIITLTIAPAGVRLMTENVTPPAGSVNDWPAVIPLSGFVDGFMSSWTLRAQTWFGAAISSEATTYTAAVIPVSRAVPLRYSR